MADVTKRLYLTKIKIVQTDISPNKTLYQILMKPNQFVKELQKYGESQKGRGPDSKSLSAHTIETYMASVMALFHHNQDFREDNYELFKKWKEHIEIVKKPTTEKYLANKPTEKQQKALVSFEKICQVRDKLPEGSMERILIALYTMIPPVRSDYAFLKIYKKKITDKDADSNNYLLISSGKKMEVVLNKYKTSDKYKQIRIKLPVELVEQINLSLEAQPREYMFVSKRGGKPYNQLKDGERAYNAWANYFLKQLFGDRFSLTMFRHIFISRPDLSLHMKTGLEQEEIARIMGHKCSTQRQYFWFQDSEESKK